MITNILMRIKNIILFFLIVVCMTSVLFAKDMTAVEQLDFANGLFKRGLYEMAITEYGKFIKSFPQNELLGEAYFGTAESRYFMKDYENADNAYKGYLKLFPKEEKAAIAAVRLGQIAYLTQKYDEALISFNLVDEDKLNEAFLSILYFSKGKTYKEKGNRENAYKFFNKAVSLKDKTEYTVYSQFELGDLYAEDSKYKEALANYEYAYRDAPKDDLKGFAQYKMGEMYFSLGDYKTASQTLKQVLDGYSKSEISEDAFANLLLALFNMAKYEDVVSEFLASKDLLSKDDAFFDVYYIVALAYAELKNYDKSIESIDAILSREGLAKDRKEKALLKKAEILLQAKRFKDMTAFIDSALAGQAGDEGYIQFLRAEAEYGLGNFEKAFELYRKVSEEFPDSTYSEDALYSMAYARNAMGDEKEASDLFVKYFETGKDKIKRQEALYNAILTKKKIGETESAVGASQRFLEVFKDSDLSENVLFGMGTLYSDMKKYDKAIEAFKNFIAEYKESGRLEEAYFLLGYNLQLEKKYDEALTYYERVLPKKSEGKLYYSALKNKALIYLNKEEDDEAAQVFDFIITEFNDNDLGPDAYLWLAKHYMVSGNFKDALRILASADKKDKGSKRKGEIAYFRGEAYSELKDFDKAIENYDVTLTDSEENVFSGAAHIGKGLALLYLNKLGEAKTEFETAILENPEDNTIAMRARYELAGIEYQTDNLEEAEKLYMLVAILYNDPYYCPEALFNAGEIFEALGKNNEARKVYQEIIDKYGDSHLVEKAKENLEALGEE